MFDENNIKEFDHLTRSILENAEEPVPSHIWEGVSKGLDKAASRKAVVVWFRRAAIASAAAAAVVAGVLLSTDSAKQSVSQAEAGMVAEIAPSQTKVSDISVVPQEAAPVQIAVVTETPKGYRTPIENAFPTVSERVADTEGVASEQPVAPAEATESVVSEITEKRSETAAESTGNVSNESATSNWFSIADDWEEEKEERSHKIRTSLVISGLAGTNTPQNKNGIGPFKAQGILKAPTKNTIEQVGSDKHFGIPVSAGFGVKINFTKRWSLGMGINYTLLTSRFEGKYIKVEDGVASFGEPTDVRNLQHYVGIPINAYFNIVSRDFINFYTYAGGTVEKCVMNKYQILSDPVINHTEATKGVQLSANIGIGVEFLVGKHLGIYIDPSLRYYFEGNQPPSIRTSQPLMLGFEMGLRFNL